MSGSASLQWIPAAATERLLYSVAEGTVLAIIVWVLLCLVPGRNSQTRFAAWFATLLSIAILPLLGGPLRPNASIASGHALITVPSGWAIYIFLGWATVAFAGLVRVAAAVWQLRKLRAGCVAIDPRVFDDELRNLIQKCGRVSPSCIMVSQDVDVPTAIGFFRPMIILPAWLVEETDSGELKYIVLHEVAHLRRRDDWTNLAQRIVKALLFFHPSVWWIERHLSLDREMACDDAVLAQSPSPKGYAQCLARVAEKSFLRRQIALAQAAVSRVRHLSLRVARILNVKRTNTTHLWKPAIPLVMTAAALCIYSAPYIPELVSFTADAPVTLASTELASHAIEAIHVAPTGSPQSGVRAWDASLRSGSSKGAPVINQRFPVAHSPMPHSQIRRSKTQMTHGNAVSASAQKPAPKPAPQEKIFTAEYQAPEGPETLVIQEEVFMVFTSFQTTSSGQQSWQMQVLQLRVVEPAPHPVQRVIPRKT